MITGEATPVWTNPELKKANNTNHQPVLPRSCSLLTVKETKEIVSGIPYTTNKISVFIIGIVSPKTSKANVTKIYCIRKKYQNSLREAQPEYLKILSQPFLQASSGPTGEAPFVL
tara:strand:- start:1248 stop:1592 length:345 start_codon:yes stop_codon:yes gene_type:complete